MTPRTLVDLHKATTPTLARLSDMLDVMRATRPRTNGLAKDLKEAQSTLALATIEGCPCLHTFQNRCMQLAAIALRLYVEGDDSIPGTVPPSIKQYPLIDAGEAEVIPTQEQSA